MDDSDADICRSQTGAGAEHGLVAGNGWYPEVRELRMTSVAAGIPSERVQVVGLDLTPAGPRPGGWPTVGTTLAAIAGILRRRLIVGRRDAERPDACRANQNFVDDDVADQQARLVGGLADGSLGPNQ